MLMFPDLVDVDENSGVEFNKNVQNLTAAVAWPVKEKLESFKSGPIMALVSYK